MQRIVVDTNVFVSALIQRNYPFLILDEVLVNPSIQICLSDSVFEEYCEVLNRKKFSRFPDFVSNAQFILSEIYRIAIRFSPSISLDVLSDKDDNKFLELANESKAHYLITGNHRDFTIREFSGTKIISPKEYYLEYMER
jgi:putative PIN family toxin of toxin-antitoxin system